MKITGGEACGRSIEIPDHPGVRPTGSLMREALFNVLGKLVEKANVLDLFAGSGLIGFEALSRGASHLTVVEKTQACVETIRANAAKLGYENKTKIIHTDFRKAIKSLNADQFNVIFADPPYMSDHCKLVTKLIAEFRLLKANGVLIVEHSKDVSVEPEDKSLRLLECRPYGQSAFSFFVSREPKEAPEYFRAPETKEPALSGAPNSARKAGASAELKPQATESSNDRGRGPRTFGDNRAARKPREGGDRDPRGPRSFGDNRAARKPREDGDRDPRGPRSFGDNRAPRPPREGGDRDPRGPRSFGDNRGPRPPREGGDRDPRGPRSFGDNRGPRKPREDGDRDPRGPRTFGDNRGPRPPREGGDRDPRGPRSFGDNRAARPFSGNKNPRGPRKP